MASDSVGIEVGINVGDSVPSVGDGIVVEELDGSSLSAARREGNTGSASSTGAKVGKVVLVGSLDSCGDKVGSGEDCKGALVGWESTSPLKKQNNNSTLTIFRK